MKTHPHLLLRDALAELFVEAARGEADANASLEALAAWSESGAVSDRLAGLRAADGDAIFDDAGALAARFAPLEGYVRDRIPRFRAARGWIRDDAAEARPVERARAAWDAGLFFEVHEILEPEWLEAEGDRRERLQGLIMAGAALHHLVEDNRAGALGLLREAGRKLDGAEDPELDLAGFGRALASLAARVESGDVRDASDIADLPGIERRPDGEHD